MHSLDPEDPELSKRVLTSLDAWKRKLLDLTKRNRALNFKVTRASTVRVVDEKVAEVFRQLYLLEQPMRFAPAGKRDFQQDPAANDEDAAASVSTRAIELDLDLGSGASSAIALSQAFVPYDRGSLDHRHADDVLQTASDPEHLDRALRRLDQLAQSSIDEQGVNTLFLAMGMLEYLESESSSERFRAPIIFLPVKLERKSARAGFLIRCSDDDPMVNPALVETLRQFGISMPQLPDSDAMPEDYDLQVFLASLQEAIRKKPEWAVTDEIALGQFSFQKFVMYKDLETNQSALTLHRVIRQVVGRTGPQIMELPADVRDLELDREFPPETTCQVVDADSSQLRAITAVARGHDLVLEGPPGTGKSQTITNLIAQALADGKSVLFVAEKMAALKVVHSRLRAAGLDEFCLELHSTRANKRLVVQEIARALDASIGMPPSPARATQHLPEVRAELSAYTHAVHAPYGALAMSPYRAYAELEAVLDVPLTSTCVDVTAVTGEAFEQSLRELADLELTLSGVGDPAKHPWRDCAKTFLSASEAEVIRNAALAVTACVDDTEARARLAASSLDLPEPCTFAEADSLAAVADVLQRSPGVPLEVLGDEAWNGPPPKALEIIERGRATEALRTHLEGLMTVSVVERDHGEDADYVLEKSQSWTRMFTMLDGRHREISKRWRNYRRPGYRTSLVEQATEMRKVDELRRARDAAGVDEGAARRFFGNSWKGEATSWDDLDAYVRWVVEFRSLCMNRGLRAKALEVASHKSPDVGLLTDLAQAVADARRALAGLAAAASWPANYLEREVFSEIRSRAKGLVENAHLGVRWVAFEAARQRVALGLAGKLLEPLARGEIGSTHLSKVFRRAFFQKWLDCAVAERPPLRAFHAMTHEQRVLDFRNLDKLVLKENRAGLIASRRQRTQEQLHADEVQKELPFLRKEMARQRALAPLRRTIREAGRAIRAIKPCFLMSPLTVAQCLPGTGAEFDLVVFDEASQVPPEDALGAILRGRQLVVVGDSKQLPPTNFFSVMGGQIEPIRGEDGQLLFEDSESILEDFRASGAPMAGLRWHYRSAHESLITFSNVNFYNGELNTFPSVETDTQRMGLRFELVPDGVYEGSGLNRAEARRVVDAVVEHARTTPALSLGVGTFSLRQQLAVLDEIEKRRRENPDLENFFASKDQEGFFVKNLENIQGDERDVIFLSVTYARGADGKLRYNFGPLNAENGWRRLNVLSTRARQHMRVFSSIRCDDINVSMTPSRGAKLLHDFLAYAESGRLENPIAPLVAETESPFEAQVLEELTRRGLTLIPQVGSAGYRIDLGVLDPEQPGRYICGLECDGVAYHSSQTARDRDRLRQQVLEDRGWVIHRIWSTDWFKDRSGQIDRILGLVQQAREQARVVAPRDGSPRSQGSDSAKRADSGFQGGAGAVRDRKSTGANSETDARSGGLGLPPYVAPVAPPYLVAPGRGRYEGDNILEAPAARLSSAALGVVEVEGPIHEEELVSRVASMWGNRAGSRIAERIMMICRDAVHAGRFRCRGRFFWPPSGSVPVRSREGMQVRAEHIAPEEYRAAVLLILGTRHAFPRADLRIEVRSLLGFSRTGHLLETEIDRAIQGLLDETIVGEASGGIALRK